MVHGSQIGQQDSRRCWYVSTFENHYTKLETRYLRRRKKKKRKREELILAEGQLINTILYVFTFFLFNAHKQSHNTNTHASLTGDRWALLSSVHRWGNKDPGEEGRYMIQPRTPHRTPFRPLTSRTGTWYTCIAEATTLVGICYSNNRELIQLPSASSQTFGHSTNAQFMPNTGTFY